MLKDRLQIIAERLAEHLNRSVIIDDGAFRPLAISSQLGRVDQSRVDYVMDRKTPPLVRQVIVSNRVEQASRPVRIPPNSDLGSYARLIIPILHEGYHLAYLWLIDEPPLESTEVDEALGCADEIGQVLADRFAREAEATDSSRQVMDGLLAEDHDLRREARDRLLADELLEGRPPYSVCIARLGDPSGSASPSDMVDTRLRRTAAELRRRLGGGVALCATPRADEMILLTTHDRSTAVAQSLRSIEEDAILGIREVDDLSTLADHLGDARFAAEVASAVPDFSGAANWEHLGVYSSLQSVERSPQGIERILPGASVLWSAGNTMYEETLRVYLDTGANAQQTAAALHIHRSSLYWRLDNLARMLNIELTSGSDRLALHLALKLADLCPDLCTSYTRHQDDVPHSSITG